MAEAILECKRKVDPHTSSSESEADEGTKKREENARKQQELEEEQRRLKKRIEKKRKRTEESSSAPGGSDTIQKQFAKILEALSLMKMECLVCKKIENPKTQLDFLRAIYIKILAIEKLVKNQQ